MRLEFLKWLFWINVGLVVGSLSGWAIQGNWSVIESRGARGTQPVGWVRETMVQNVLAVLLGADFGVGENLFGDRLNFLCPRMIGVAQRENMAAPQLKHFIADGKNASNGRVVALLHLLAQFWEIQGGKCFIDHQ